MSATRKSTQAQAGFIALETLVAFAILVMLLAAGYHALTLGLHSARAVKERAVALLEARSLLARLRAYPAILPPHDKGRFASGASWLLQVVPLVAPAQHGPQRFWARLQVRDSRNRELFVLQTVILRPAPRRKE